MVAESLASCLSDSSGWKLSPRTDHHTQNCPSNTRLPWKQPSSKLAQGGAAKIMEDQTEPCLPGDVLLLKLPPSSLSFPVKPNETGGERVWHSIWLQSPQYPLTAKQACVHSIKNTVRLCELLFLFKLIRRPNPHDTSCTVSVDTILERFAQEVKEAYLIGSM